MREIFNFGKKRKKKQKKKQKKEKKRKTKYRSFQNFKFWKLKKNFWTAPLSKIFPSQAAKALTPPPPLNENRIP